MSIELKVAKAHEQQLKDPETLMEFQSVSKAINNARISFVANAINFVFVKGVYNHADRKMVTACIFINKMDKPINELHGVIDLRFKYKCAKIAKTTLNFDEPFLGVLHPDEAVLVHLGIPVRGLSENEMFVFSDIAGGFEDVRISFAK